jgi:Mce-associated membrane protein
VTDPTTTSAPESRGVDEPASPPPAPERTRFAEPPAVESLAGPEQVAEEPASAPAEPAVVEEPLPVEAAEPEPVVAAPLPVANSAIGAAGALVPVLAAVAVVLTGLTGYLGWRAYDTGGQASLVATRKDVQTSLAAAQRVDASSTQALMAARSAARLVFSYDYRKLAADFKAGRAVTTGAFQQEYDRTTQRLVDDVAPRYKAVVVADVSEAAVVRAEEAKVVCLVFVNQQSSSSLMKGVKVTQSRLEMTLVRTGDRWLVSAIKAL